MKGRADCTKVHPLAINTAIVVESICNPLNVREPKLVGAHCLLYPVTVQARRIYTD